MTSHHALERQEIPFSDEQNEADFLDLQFLTSRICICGRICRNRLWRLKFTRLSPGLRLRGCTKPVCSQARLQLSSLFRFLLSFLQKVTPTVHPGVCFHEMKGWGKASHCHLPGVICPFLAMNPPGRAKLWFSSIVPSWWLFCLFVFTPNF